MSESFIDQLRADGLASSSSATLDSMKGGVSSDIYLLRDEERTMIVKRALPKLKVESDWFADVARNETEWRFMKHVAKTNPSSVPEIISTGKRLFCD
ncbi:MAG: hypothetical protein P8L44_06510 [Opitutales bacterium]|jgi:5-methylthioribose kinase|nr:hypothetical protein [Opitutales bacterium]